MFCKFGGVCNSRIWRALDVRAAWVVGRVHCLDIGVHSSRRLPKFYLLWGLAFVAYAAGWVFAYFTLGSTAGEWVGSLVGSVLMTIVFALGLSATRSIPKLAVLLFIANSAGYFLGSTINEYVGGRSGMLLWGVVYGLFLGAGLGALLSLSRN